MTYSDEPSTQTESARNQHLGRRQILSGLGLVGVGAVAGAAGLAVYEKTQRNRIDAPPRAEDSDQDLTAGVFFRAKSRPDQPRLALTFDDGPDEKWTPQVLRLLEAAPLGGTAEVSGEVAQTPGKPHARATFFQMGNALKTNAGKDLCREVIAAGHEVGVHAFEHYNLTTLSLDEVRRQVKSTLDALTEVTGTRPRLFRPPYGAINGNVMRVAAENNLQVVLWSHHVTGSAPEAMRRRLLSSQADGAVVLMHDGRGDPNEDLMATLGRILDDLQQKRFRTVTVSALQHEQALCAI